MILFKLDGFCLVKFAEKKIAGCSGSYNPLIKADGEIQIFYLCVFVSLPLLCNIVMCEVRVRIKVSRIG